MKQWQGNIIIGLLLVMLAEWGKPLFGDPVVAAYFRTLLSVWFLFVGGSKMFGGK